MSEPLRWPFDGTFDEYDALQAECEWEAMFGPEDNDSE